MLEPKPRNIQDDCDASNLGSFLHSDELKQSEGCCEQFLAARHSGIPLTKPKLSIFTQFLSFIMAAPKYEHSSRMLIPLLRDCKELLTPNFVQLRGDACAHVGEIVLYLASI